MAEGGVAGGGVSNGWKPVDGSAPGVVCACGGVGHDDAAGAASAGLENRLPPVAYRDPPASASALAPPHEEPLCDETPLADAPAAAGNDGWFSAKRSGGVATKGVCSGDIAAGGTAAAANPPGAAALLGA
jgi:hypothetical protein